MSTKKKRGFTPGLSGNPEKQFKPGQSGNPGGRPKLPENFKARGPEVLDFLMAVALGEKKAPMKDRVLASKWCAERIYGAPVQALDLDPDNKLPPAALALRELVLARQAERAAGIKAAITPAKVLPAKGS